MTAKNPSELLGAGADGYLLKDASSTELVLALRTVSIGPRFLCEAIAATSAEVPRPSKKTVACDAEVTAAQCRGITMDAMRNGLDGLRL